MDFTAIDFETANASRASICAVGLVRVENGEVVEQFHRLVNPQCSFNFYNTAVHGITAFDVRDAPCFCDVYEDMKPFLADNVVAHNAAFDISCLRSALERYDIAAPDFDYFCTLCISRKVLANLPSRKLDVLAQYYGLGDFNHHNALDDARICAQLFGIFSDRCDVAPMKKSFREKTVRRAKPDVFETARRTLDRARKHEERRALHTPQTDLEFDYSPVDFSKTFVVSGDFGEMGAQYVEGLIARQGGRIRRTVDAETDYVVVADSPSAAWGAGEYGREIDAALCYGRAKFLRMSHLLREIM